VFLLSPASSSGERARLITSGLGGFALARRLAAGDTAPIGEIMAFTSGLYFRGKAAYAREFARPPAGCPGAFVITPTRGLRTLDDPISLDELREYASVDIHANEDKYRAPLERHLGLMLEALPKECDVILLGSVASDKYVTVLTSLLGQRVRFPIDFVGRGDMSRGGLMLRCVDDRRELAYAPILGAPRRGGRPPKLPPRRRR
jgi:hypothetical protein